MGGEPLSYTLKSFQYIHGYKERDHCLNSVICIRSSFGSCEKFKNSFFANKSTHLDSDEQFETYNLQRRTQGVYLITASASPISAQAPTTSAQVPTIPAQIPTLLAQLLKPLLQLLLLLLLFLLL